MQLDGLVECLDGFVRAPERAHQIALEHPGVAIGSVLLQGEVDEPGRALHVVTDCGNLCQPDKRRAGIRLPVQRFLERVLCLLALADRKQRIAAQRQRRRCLGHAGCRRGQFKDLLIFSERHEHFAQHRCDAIALDAKRGRFLQLLFSCESVACICVDSAQRKSCLAVFGIFLQRVLELDDRSLAVTLLLVLRGFRDERRGIL